MYDFTEIVFTQNKSNVRLSKYSILFIILIVKTHENIWFNNLTANCLLSWALFILIEFCISYINHDML